MVSCTSLILRLVFDVALHVGTLLAVLVYFWRNTLDLVRGWGDILRLRWSTKPAKLVGVLVLATIPVCITGYLLKDFVSLGARNFTVLGVTSILFGVLLWAADQLPREKYGLPQVTWLHALIFGMMQALAVIPGTSRSGITMTAGRFMGFRRVHAAQFSMLMAIPVIMVSAEYTVYDGLHQAITWQNDWPQMAFGVSISFVSALLAIGVLMRFVSKFGFGPFVLYRLFLGAALLVLGAWS